MNIAPGVKSRGRPKKTQGGAPTFNKTNQTKKKRARTPENNPTTDIDENSQPPKKKRGRPKGAKNKPKQLAVTVSSLQNMLGASNNNEAAQNQSYARIR